LRGCAKTPVYVYQKPAQGWSTMIETDRLFPMDGEFGVKTLFGIGLDISGDVMIVAAPGDHEFGLYYGSVYLFKSNGE